MISNENKYVTIPKYKPLSFPRKNWQERSYELFQTDSDLTVIFDDNPGLIEDMIRKEPVLVRESIEEKCIINEKIENEVISFNTNCMSLSI